MDNVTLNTARNLKTVWGIEKHGSDFFAHEVFKDFQKEVIAARDHCLIDTVVQEGDFKITGTTEDCRRPRVVHYNRSTMVATCTCKLFETHGVPCRHIIPVLRGARLNELPSYYLLERFTGKDIWVSRIAPEEGFPPKFLPLYYGVSWCLLID